MDDGVEMIRHEAELKNARLGVIIMNVEQLVDDCIAKVGTVDDGLDRVVVGGDKVAEELFAIRSDECQVIDADTTPSSSVFLPMPRFCHCSEFWSKGTIKNRDTQIF